MADPRVDIYCYPHNNGCDEKQMLTSDSVIIDNVLQKWQQEAKGMNEVRQI